jgi:hypothetical protein
MIQQNMDLINIGLDAILTAGVFGVLGYLLNHLRNLVPRQEMEARIKILELQICYLKEVVSKKD